MSIEPQQLAPPTEQPLGDQPPQPPPQTPPPGQIPAWQEKAPQFQSPEALAEGYLNLQREYTQLKQNAPQSAPQQTPSSQEGGDPSSPESQPGDAETPQPQPIVDWSNNESYLDEKTGWLNEETQTKLAEATGMPAEMLGFLQEAVEGYRQSIIDNAQQIAGGKEQLDNVLDYARKNEPEALALLDNPKTYKVALQGLMSAMQAGQPSQPNQPAPAPGTSAAGTGTETPISPQEAARFTIDPRYNTDMEWTRNIQRRMQMGRTPS